MLDEWIKTPNHYNINQFCEGKKPLIPFLIPISKGYLVPSKEYSIINTNNGSSFLPLVSEL